VKVTTICPYYINTGMFEGARTNLMFPMLDQNATVSRIISAILQEEGEVTIPWNMGVLSHLLKAILPSDVHIWVNSLFVGLDVNSRITGR
jgi:all-trans-retinol dehydrogenase (NAD+)